MQILIGCVLILVLSSAHGTYGTDSVRSLSQYSIGPEDLRRALDRNPKVTACLIALGDGAEAEHLPRALPGKVYRVKETSDLARTIKSVLGKMVGATL